MTPPSSIFIVPPSDPRGRSLGDPLFQPNPERFNNIPANTGNRNFGPPVGFPAPPISEEFYKRNKFTPTQFDDQPPPYSSPPRVSTVLAPFYNNQPTKAPIINNKDFSFTPPDVRTLNTIDLGVLQQKTLLVKNYTPINRSFFTKSLAEESTTSDTGLVYNFFKNIGSWPGGIPLQHFWIIKFNFTNNFKITLKSWANNIFSNKNEGMPWNFNVDTILRLLDKDLQGDSIAQSNYLQTGCYFARSVSVPGERLDTVNPAIPAAGGLYFNNVINKRQNPSNLQISFMETNASFIDLFLRPWSILSSYCGSIGRNSTSNNNDDTLKVDVEAIFYSKSQYVSDTVNNNLKNGQQAISRKPYDLRAVKTAAESLKDIYPIPRKKFTFKSAQPISINNQEYTQTGEALQIRPVDFIYNSYNIETYE